MQPVELQRWMGQESCRTVAPRDRPLFVIAITANHGMISVRDAIDFEL